MRKPANWSHAIVFDIKLENKMTARKAKLTRLQNMLKTGKPVFCTVAKIRVQVALCQSDSVHIYTSNGYMTVSLDSVRLFSHSK